MKSTLESSQFGLGIYQINADMAISGCHFENQRFGISKHNTYPGGRGVSGIKNNTFEDCRWSILLDGGDFTRIAGNTFQIPHDTDTLQIAAGIVNLGSNAVQIKDGNSFGASDANNSFFIYSDKLVDQHASEITRNTFGRADSSSWRQVELQGSQDSLQIFCNNFSLSAGTDFAVGMEDGTALMAQGTPERPAGNDWSTLGNCLSMSHDETHIYSNSSNDSLNYIAFLDKEPDCISHNVFTSNVGITQEAGYCDIPTPCPPPSIPCGTDMLDSTLLVIDTLLYRPPYGMSQAEIDRNLGFANHSKNIIVQDILIDLLEQDSIELALEWLDTVAVRMDHFDSLHLLMLDRYEDLLQRPDHSGALATTSVILKQAISAKIDLSRQLFPLTRENISKQPQQITLNSAVKHYKIWPNPANGELNLLWQSYSPQNKRSVIIHDIHGKVFKKIEFFGLEHQILNLSEWTSGIYVVKIYLGTNLSGIEKLVILH